jgi:hypothetical protein
VALGELIRLFLNGVQPSVNRKVQGSNPWSGANFRMRFRGSRTGRLVVYFCTLSAPALAAIPASFRRRSMDHSLNRLGCTGW